MNLNLDTNLYKHAQIFFSNSNYHGVFHLPQPSATQLNFSFVSSRNTVKLQHLQWTHTLTLTTLRGQLPQKPVTAMLLARVLVLVARPAATMVTGAPLIDASRRRQNDLRMLPLYVVFSLFISSASFGKAGAQSIRGVGCIWLEHQNPRTGFG